MRTIMLMLTLCNPGGFTVTVERSSVFVVEVERFKASQIVDQRPIVYRLHATWCGPCRELERLLTKAVRDKLPFQVVDWDVDKQGYMGATQIPGFWWKSPRGNLRCNWSNLETLIATWKATQTPIKASSEVDALSPELRAMYERAKAAGYTDSQIRSYAVRRGWIK